MPDENRGSLRSAWGWMAAYAVLLALLAFVALAHPWIVAVATGLVLAWSLCVFGVFAMIAGFRGLRGRGGWLEAILGFLAFAGGMLILFDPLAGAVSLVNIVGIWLAIIGAIELAAAFGIGVDRWWHVFLGVLNILLGVLILTTNATGTLAILAIYVAITLLTRATFLFMLALRLKNARGV